MACGSRSVPSVVCDRGRTAVVAADRCSRACSPMRCRAWTRTAPRPISGRSRAPSSPRSSSARLGTLIRLDGVRGRRSGALFDSDLTVRHRIPTVTAERALIDVSSRLIDEADRPCARRCDPRRLIDLEEFRRCAQRLLPAPGRSMSKVHAVLGARIPGYDPGDSDLETRALRALTAAGLPPPKQQHRIDAARQEGRGSTSRIPS